MVVSYLKITIMKLHVLNNNNLSCGRLRDLVFSLNAPVNLEWNPNHTQDNNNSW